MGECDRMSATMKAKSQSFLYNLEKTDFTVKKATKAFLLDNDNSILYLETSDFDVTRALVAQTVINFKKDTTLKGNLNEIVFINFNSLNIMSPEENETFSKNFPDLCICTLDIEEQLTELSSILAKWMNIIKVNNKKIIFIAKSAQNLQKVMIKLKMANIFEVKLNKLWNENETNSNDEPICTNQTNLMTNESTSDKPLDQPINININKKKRKRTNSQGESTNDDEDLMKLLLSLGVEELDAVDQRGNTQLHLAARNGNMEIIESLLRHGAKKDVKNNWGQTALHLAACCNHDDASLVEILLKFGAEMERKGGYGRTALHLASLHGNSAVVNSLLKNGAKINEQDKDGDTPLHRATYGNQQEIVSILLQHGALFKIKNKYQQNALDLAKNRKYTEIIQIFENHK